MAVGLLGLVSAAPASAASGGDVFCQSIGYNIWCGLDSKTVVGKTYFNSSGQFCVRARNGYGTRKSVALDVAGTLGSMHKVGRHKTITVCRSIPDKLVRATLRVRVSRERDLAAGTWLVARDPAKRVVTNRKMVATKAKPTFRACARNTLKRKAMLYMYWNNKSVTHTKHHIKPGKTGCVEIGVSGSGSTNVKIVWLNSKVAHGVEAWVGRSRQG